MLEIIKLVDAKSWIGFFGVLFGAGLGLSGVVFANRSSLLRLKLQLATEKDREHAQIKRERLEELYVLLSQWANMFFSHFFKLTLVMKGDIDYNQYLDEVIEDGKSSNVDFQRIEMILNIYGRELLPIYEDILKCRSKINEISAAHKADYKRGKFNGEKYLEPYSMVHTELDIKVKELKRQLAELATNA
ncbi:hypothetical protein ACCH75_003375 [Vibrio parahaemolyticus]|nr:hypothetical protein [Vibrio parahaemolyticus]EJE4675957.1 hypothetical protein [Vibrio parahaemolyticus]EJG1572096.1 hypothetical protein [Vibrio parahaemolyticus]HAS6573622.1 hypothetical protein [Vibrio parahaemolyticus]